MQETIVPPITDDDVVDEMERTGGGFVRALAAAARKADRENLRRIKAAFPEYWVTYSERVRQRLAVRPRV